MSPSVLNLFIMKSVEVVAILTLYLSVGYSFEQQGFAEFVKNAITIKNGIKAVPPSKEPGAAYPSNCDDYDLQRLLNIILS